MQIKLNGYDPLCHCCGHDWIVEMSAQCIPFLLWQLFLILYILLCTFCSTVYHNVDLLLLKSLFTRVDELKSLDSYND